MFDNEHEMQADYRHMTENAVFTASACYIVQAIQLNIPKQDELSII